jgi:hypothetical protein
MVQCEGLFNLKYGLIIDFEEPKSAKIPRPLMFTISREINVRNYSCEIRLHNKHEQIY